MLHNGVAKVTGNRVRFPAKETAVPAPTIEDAIDALRKLSPERQQELAPYICHLAKDEPEAIDPADPCLCA